VFRLFRSGARAQRLPSIPSCILSRAPHAATQVLRGQRVTGQRRRRCGFPGEFLSSLT
jgi:hypothetical protein